MIIPMLAFSMVVALLIVCSISMIQHIQVWSLDHLRLDITFFIISLLSTIVMSHILITNRAEIKVLVDDWVNGIDDKDEWNKS